MTQTGPTRREFAEHHDGGQIGVADALIALNECFLRYTDAVAGAHLLNPAPGLSIAAAENDIDCALHRLDRAWAAAHLRRSTPNCLPTDN